MDYLTDSRGLTADISNGLGSSAPFVAASMLAPEVGVGGWLARGAGSALERMGASRLGQAVASDLVQAGANDFARYALTSGPLEAAVNAGGIYDDLKKQGLSDSEILSKMNGMIGEELPVDMLTSGLYGAVLGGNTFSRLGQGGWKRAIAANALNTPADMLGEYMQEMTQQQVQNKYSGKPYGTFFNPTEDEMQAGRAAAMGTLPMGIFGSARGTRHSRLAAMAAADGGSVTGPTSVTPSAVPDPNVDPVAAAQLEGKNDDVPTADGVDVTELDPQQFEQWYDGKVSAPKLDMPSGNIDVPNPNVGNSGKNSGTNVMEAAQGFMGKRMDNGENGCVEAVTKIGARYNPFLADELNKGVVNVDTLVGDAGDAVVPFAPANVQAGDVLVYGDNDHVVIADGNGGYVGNSSSQKKVVHGDDYNNMGDLKPTKIIKTGGTESQASDTLEGNGSLTKSSGNDQYDAWITQSAAEHGVPANLLSSLLEVESGYNPDAKSGAGAVGIAQFMPSTAEEIGIDPMNPQQAIEGAAIYLRQKYDKYGDWHKALEAYNGGDGNVGKGETMAYADKVLDGAGDISSAPAKSLSLDDFGNVLTSKALDFAGTNDDTVRKIYHDMAVGDNDEAVAALFVPYMQDGVFQNTADVRTALAQNDAFRNAMAMFVQSHIGDYAPAAKEGRISIDDAREALRLRAAGKTETPHIDVKKLSAEDKKAVMAAAKETLQVPQGLFADDEVRFLNQLGKAIDYKDYTAIVQLIPQQSAQAVMAARNAGKTVDKVAPVPQQVANQVPEVASQVQAPAAVNGPAPVNHAPETMQNVSVQAPANQVSDGVRAAAPTRDVVRVKEIGAMPVDTRKAMGEQYLSTLRANNVPFSEKRLAKPLAQGKPEAIEFAERKYGDVLNTVTPAEAAMQVAARGPVAPMEAGNNARTNVEEAIANENTQSEYAADKNAENQNQHAKPEPRKAAESQPEAKAGAVSAPQSVHMESDPSYLRQLEKEKANRERAKRILANSVWAGIEKELTPEGLKKLRDAAETSAVRGEDHLMADLADILPSDFKNPPKNFREAIRRGNAVTDKVNRLLAKIIRKHPEQADVYRVALAGAPDYHGFLDDLRPGAIRQIRSVLEAVGSPFGAGKGSMSVKKLMESLARSPYTKESTKETSSGAVQYMLNGNRVPKAAYRYYQYLKSIGYSEEQDAEAKAGEPKTLAPGYRTESGKPLSEAGEKEFILKPDGSKDFGEITDAISKAAKEQSGADLAPGKIRLRVGNDKEGLLHAKKHEEQAKADGYVSIEDMIADVAENFDAIYAHGLTGNEHTTYSLVKHGNKATGKMNGVAPVYLNLEDDGHGNYYVIVTAIPKGDANLARQTKKDRLIYSSPGLGAATESNAGAVSTSAKNVGAETRGGTPTSDKSSGSSTPSVAQEQESGKKNIAYTDGSFSDKSKNDNAMRGTVKNGVMTIWRKGGKKKDMPIITVSVDEVDKALKKGSANSEYTFAQLAKQKDYAAVEAWIGRTKKPELRQKRRDYWENDNLNGKLSAAESRAVDSAVRVIKKLYETATGEKPRSPWEKKQEAKKNAPEARAQEPEKPVNEKAVDSAAVSDIIKRTADSEAVRNAAANADEQELRSEIAAQLKEVVTQRMVDAVQAGGDSLKSMKVINDRYSDEPAFRKDLEDSVFDAARNAAKKEDSIFGSVEDADREMLDALGLSDEDLKEEVLEAPEGISNTAEERERLEKELAAELNKLSANPVFNPKIYTLGLKLAMTYVKDGYNTFKKLVTKLHAAFGDKIGPWAPALAETVRTWPKGVPFDEKKVMAISKAVGARYEGGITSLDEMQDDMKKLLKGQHKSFAPMIEASYNGIRKFFDEKGAQEHGDEGKQEKGESSDAGREGRQSAASEGAGEGRPEPGGVSGAEGGNREVPRGGNPGRSEREDPERVESSGVRAGAELETAAGAGDRERGSEKPVLTEAQAHPSPEETPGHDYEIKPSKTKKTPAMRFRQNIDALKLLKQLEADDRMPMPKEQAVLGSYNGWGGLKEAFLDTKMNKELRAVLTPEEYKAAQSTVNDAFYTPANIVRAVWKGVSRLGFTGGRVLDPSMGVGNFFGCMPRDMMKSSSLRGIEIDDLTSRLARMLYPSALVEHTGFEKAQLADNFYDLVISNIPFDGSHSIAGYKIHNYFFAHGMDKVRPGGLMVYITSQGSLTNSQDGARMRDYLGKKADMVAAYKLPSGAFGEAGTSVGTDIVIFRKRGEHEMKPGYAQDFQHVGKMFTYSDNSGGVPVNEYFKAHPENIIGEASKGRDQYGNDVLLVKPKEGADVAKELSKAMNKLPKDIYEPVNRTGEGAFDPVKANRKARADEKTHDLEYYEKDGKVYQNQDGTGVEVKGAKTIARLKGYLKVKGAMNSLILAEMDPDAKEATVGHLRKQLNAAYDAYVKKNGYLNDPVGRRSYIDDPSAGAVMALEKVEYTGFGAKKKIEKAEKAAIFEERSIAPIKEVTSVDSPNDALIVSLRNKGRVDLPYMAKLMGSTPETVASGLDGQIFKNPATERYETRDEYLSGNVREKLAQAENAAAQDSSYQKNADELRKVVPKDLIPDEICVTMGAPWIPASDVQAFADHITGRAGSLSVKFIPSNAKWVVDGYGHSGKYEAKGIDLSDLLSDILNNKAIEIYSGRGDERALDREATDAASLIAGDMKEDFRTWLWSDKARAKRLARYYNDNYNNTVLREYDGSHLTFPGHNEKIELKPHQKNVVWRMLQGGNTLIAHCVGAGKTFEMQAAGMEMRRLGIANKPLYILPNNVVEQFTKEFYELYPNARLLVLQNDSKTRPGYIPAVPKSTIEQKVEREDGRKETVTIQFSKLSAADRKKVTEARALRTRTLAQIKTEDWDGIIMSHSQFERLPLSPETAASFIEEQLDEVEQAITEAKEGKVDKRTLGTIENQKKKLEENLDAVMKTDPRDIGVPFEQLGIDQIFVDEADMFKNLHYTTSMDRVNGLPNSNANRSMDMYAKTRWLTNANGGRGVVFATGTPVSNTMAEMFTMMRYLDFQGLKEKGLNLFDNWLRTFGEIGSGIERNPSGSGFRKVNKVLRFINMPELTKMFRKFADVKTQDDLDLDIPKLKGGKPTIVKIAPDPVLTNYIKNDVPRRIANMAKRREDMRKGADNMLALTGDLRKMSITDSKIDALADEVVRKYEETTDVKGAQLIFCDQGIPKAEKDNAKDDEEGEDNSAEAENAPVYNKIITALEERGIPKEQIVFIQSAKNKAQMEEIFKKVDSGDIRILIGSTQKMGAGTNCQHHLVALHDLDAPWRPRDLEQRHGRILRQGNPNKEVEIFNYVLQDSFDPIMWEKLKNKAAIVAQAMSSNMQQRTVGDADLVTLTYADAENAGTSDPLVKERIALDSEIKKYKHAQVAFNRKMGDAESAMETAPKKIEELKSAIENIKDDMDARQDTRGDKFRMTVAGKEYTERKEAQTALGSALADLTGKVSTKIGEVSGFDIKAYLGSDNQPHIQLVRKRAYMANTATVAGVENALRKAPESLLDARETELREKEESLKTAKEIVDQKNPYAEKLAAMEKRFKEINQQIEKNMLGKADDSKEESEAPKERYSAEEQLTADSRAWKETLREAWKGNMPDSTMLPVMQTPVALKLVGVPDYPMVMRQSKLMKIKKDHPEMTKAILNQLPSYLADPMIIFKSSTVPGRLVVGLALKDEAGIHVVVPVELNAKAGRVDVNVITSAYGKGVQQTGTNVTWFVDNILEGNTVYINKKQAADFYQSAGLQLPMEGRRFNDLFGSSIKTDADLVKAKLEDPERYFAEEQQKEQARVLDDLKQEVRDALPGARDIRDDGNRLSFTMPNGAKVEVQLSPSIDVSETAASRARAAHGIKPSARVKINGRERTIGTTALVELSQLGRKGSAYHEVLHAVYDLCLTEKEKAALHRAFDKEAKAQGRDVYEVMADQYRDWMLARQQGRGTRFGKLWQKVKDMAAALRRVLRRADHASDVFRKVESGEVWKRATDAGKTQKKYSAEGVENPGEADYNEDRLSDNQKEMLFDSVKRVFDSQVKVLKQHGITEDEINAELTAHNSEQRTKALAGLKATYNQLHAKGLNQEGKREIVERISGNKNLSNAQISALFTKLKTYSEGAVDYAGVIYRELAVHRRGDYGNASQVLTWRDIDRFRGIAERKENNINESRSDIRDGFSSAQNPMHYSVEAEEAPKNFVKKVFLKLAKKSYIKGDKIIVEEQGEEKPTIGLTNYVLSSPSRIASKVQSFRMFFRMADRAMNILTKNRSDYARKLGEAMDFVKKKSDRQALYEILLNGDAEGKEYTRQELVDDGISDNVIEAYMRIRRLMTKAYRMVDDARRRPKVTSKRMTDRKIAELRENHFIEVMRVGAEEDDGRRLVTYKEYANHEKVYQNIDQETRDRFRADDAMQVLGEKKNGDGSYTVKVREGIPHMNRLGGYIPHFFHDYMIRVKDSDGGYVMTLGSGRTEREAVKKAEAYLKEHALPEGQKIYISPKVMDFTTLGMSEQQYGAVMGDMDYFKMLASIAKNNDLSLEEAKALMEGSARMKNRHRFFGNAMHRTGVKGYETDLDWVLRHYFNSASRYAALETEFKPQAISLYERLYGDFDRDAPSKEADYIKDYIHDINGNPSTLEKAINEALMKSKLFRQFVVPRFGDRAALTLASKLSNAISYMCLGYFNTSSALLNLTQVMNSAAYIGDVSALAKCIAKGAHRKYSMHDLKILMETNVLNDIGLDSGSGYDMNRMSAKNLLGKLNRGGMWMFKTSEGIVRRGTVLAAYEAGRKRGMTHEEAIAFAKDVNRKSNFDYGVSDAPNIFRRGSIVSQLALQFKKYGIKELEVMADMFPTNSKTSRKQKAIFWGTYFLAAGLMGLPMLDFFDKWPFDEKLKLSVEECLMEVAGDNPLGKKLATAALFGVAAAVLGIDLSNRAGLSDVIPTRGSDLMGPALSKVANLISDSLKGNGMSAIRDVSPGIYNVMAAARGYSEGKRGRVNDRYNTFYDKVLRAMGFKSTDERVNSDIDRIVNMRKKKETQEKQDAIDAYLDNPSAENARRLKALGVKPKTVADERKKKQQSRRERTQSGMSKPKQQENERLMQFGD